MTARIGAALAALLALPIAAGAEERRVESAAQVDARIEALLDKLVGPVRPVVMAAKTGEAPRVAQEMGFPADPSGVARTEGQLEDETTIALGEETRFELHGYARMPLNLHGTPRQPYLIDNDYYLSGFAYTRLYEPDWSELFFSAHYGNYRAKFGLFASLYSDYAEATLDNQLGIAQASVAADEFLGYEPLSVEAGVFWDRFGYIEPYDTYIFGRTHQGGVKARWSWARAHVQAGIGIHQRPPQSQGLTALSHLSGAATLGPATVGAYFLRAWTRDKPQLSNIEDGDLWVGGLDTRVALPRELGSAYVAASYYKAEQALFLAPALELLHSTGGRGLTENFLGTQSSNNGTGSLYTLALDAPLTPMPRVTARLFGMMTWVRSDQVDEMDPLLNKDRRMYLKWGAEPGYQLTDHVIAGVRYDRVIMDLYDSANSFRVISPKVTFPLAEWGELFVMYSRYVYGDKIQLRPGQVPLETMPDTNVFKVQAQAVW